MLRNGLLRLLPQLLMVAIPEGEAPQARTFTEAVVTQLSVRALSTRQAAGCTPQHQGMHNLLCVPLLWSKVPSLAPIASRICRMAVSSLAGCPGALAMAKLLPGESDWVPGGKVAALAALFGNLVSVGERIFQQADKPLAPEASYAAALQLTHVLHWVLCLLPLEPFFPGKPSREDLEEDPRYASARTAADLASAHCRGGSGRIDSEEMLPGELQGQVTQVFERPGKQLLQQLVASLLPLSASGASARQQSDYTASWASCMQGATMLCLLLGQLLALPGQRQRLLLILAFGAELVPRMWYSLLKGMRLQELHGGQQQQQQQDRGSAATASTSASAGGILPHDHPCAQLLPLNLMCAVFSAQLAVGDLDEMYVQQRPIPIAELYSETRPSAGVLALLRSRLWSVLWEEPGTPSASSTRQQTDPFAAALKREFSFIGGQLYGDLYDRNCRRRFCPEHVFRAPNLGPDRLDPDRFVQEAAAPRATGRFKKEDTRAWQVLQHAPALVPFEDRARLFQTKVAETRSVHHEMELAQMDSMGIFQPRFVHIRRQNLLYDGYDSLHKLGDGLKGRVRVQFIDEHGEPEAGVDGGGLFKDFMESLIKQGFHTQYGLFTANAQNELYPSPASFELMEDAPRLLEFLGCMLGKAMYEGILLELPLARFFLKKFRGGMCDLNDLPSLDDELYENLRKLRQSPGVVSDLGLVFTATRQVYGKHEDVDLKPNGRNIHVTPENAVEYIHRIADFRLNKELRGPCNAFLSGFFMMIQPEWIAMFNEEELQTLISGRMEEGLDLEDLRAHTGYAGGYHEEHPVILDFWSVLSTFSPEQQREFLKFVTACSRAPLLGFKYLEPQFCIQMAGSVLDPSSPERLPTAATCMNLLKLPPYRAPKALREKLLYAISSAHSFDLS
uniref:HECT-type E3 ubiquitin transferase n=1 Tax=Dunaliella tertiolecta TaxID=3047 RepID=A0A6S8NUX6_DUNTE